MAIFTGTNADEFITPTRFSGGTVTADPPGSRPSAASDILYGEGGDDTLDAAGGDDSIFGGAGNDEITGGLGADTLVGGSGDDVYREVDASDVLVESADGGSDSVLVLDNWVLGAYFENLVLGANVTAAIGNSLANIMGAVEFHGTLYGLGGEDTLSSGEGNATLIGGAGDDRYHLFAFNIGFDDDSIVEDAGGGRDTVDIFFDGYQLQDLYVVEDNVESAYLHDTQYYDEDGNIFYHDSGVEGNSSANDIHGGEGPSQLLGMGGADSLDGGGDNDQLDGGAGRDYLDGGDGVDWVLYTGNTTTVRVDLVAGSVSFPGQPWGAETVVSIESAWTGSGNDILIGNNVDNSFDGGGGDDSFDGGDGDDFANGRSGNDSFAGGADNDGFVGGTGNDSFDGGAGNDYFNDFGAGNDSFDGGAGNDNFVGGIGDDSFAGGAGNDYFNGDAGNDTVLYTANTTSVRVDLAAGRASFPGQPWAPEDFDGVENAVTGSGADILLGNGVANQLRGGAGADHLTGRGGAELLIGGIGNDVFHFAAGHSTGAVRDRIVAGDNAVAFQRAGLPGGDQIDVSAIDADTTTDGNQAFAFGTTIGKGRLWAVSSGDTTLIRGSTDGDAAAEIEIAILDGAVRANAYAGLDFML